MKNLSNIAKHRIAELLSSNITTLNHPDRHHLVIREDVCKTLNGGELTLSAGLNVFNDAWAASRNDGPPKRTWSIKATLVHVPGIAS